jgi:putative membrane protein
MYRLPPGAAREPIEGRGSVQFCLVIRLVIEDLPPKRPSSSSHFRGSLVMSMHKMKAHVFVAVLLSSAGACASPTVQPRVSRPAVAPVPLPGEDISAPRSVEYVARPMPSDGNIAAILLAANNADISYARLAQTRAQSPAVRDFAQRMLADHAAVNELLNAVLNSSKLVAADSHESLKFRDVSAATRDLLRKLDAAAFDSSYVANEVSCQIQLLQSIDRDLQPLAAQPQLRQLITDIRPKVAEHLEAARQLRTTLVESK